MTAADDFTRADPLYINAMRHAAHTGEAFQVSGTSSGQRSGWWLVLIGLAVVGLGLWGMA